MFQWNVLEVRLAIGFRGRSRIGMNPGAEEGFQHIAPHIAVVDLIGIRLRLLKVAGLTTGSARE